MGICQENILQLQIKLLNRMANCFILMDLIPLIFSIGFLNFLVIR